MEASYGIVMWENRPMTLKKWALILIPAGIVFVVLGVAGFVTMTALANLFWLGALVLVAGIAAALASAWRREPR